MKTSYYLAAAAVLAAAGVAVHARLPVPTSLPTPSVPVLPVAPPPPSQVPSGSPFPALPAERDPLPTLPPLGIEPPSTPTLPAVPPPSKVDTPVVPPVPVAPPMVPSVPTPAAPSVPAAPITPPMIPSVPTPSAPSVPAAPITPPSLPVTPPSVPRVPPPPEVTAPVAPVTPITPPASKPIPLPAVPPPESVSPPTVAPPAPPAPTTPTAHRFVVLADGKLLEGIASETADKVTLRRGALEQSYPKDKVQFIAANKDEVYRQMLAKVPPTDAAARMKLAKWMLFAGMREQARQEALEVVKLQPTNTAAADMARSLEESLRRFPENGKPATEVPPAPPNATVAPGLPAVPPNAPVAPPTSEPELTMAPEAAAMYATRIQPILVNLCADCHAKPTYTGSFKLTGSDAFEDRPQVIAQNLKSIAAQLRKGDPASSPLMLKAAIAHGGMKQPAFQGKPAAKVTLERWVYAAAGVEVNSTEGRPDQPAAPAAPPIPPAVHGASNIPLPAVPPPPGIPAPSATPLPPVPPPSPPSGSAPLPPGAGAWSSENWPVHPNPQARFADPPKPDRPKFGEDIKPTPPSGPDPANSGTPVDEFDPSVFNRAVQSPRR